MGVEGKIRKVDEGTSYGLDYWIKDWDFIKGIIVNPGLFFFLALFSYVK